MRPTDFCFPSRWQRAPAHRSFPSRLYVLGGAAFHDAADRFGGPVKARERAFSSPLRPHAPHLWHPCRAHRRRAALSRSALPRRRTPRSPRRRASWKTCDTRDPRCLHPWGGEPLMQPGARCRTPCSWTHLVPPRGFATNGTALVASSRARYLRAPLFWRPTASRAL